MRKHRGIGVRIVVQKGNLLFYAETLRYRRMDGSKQGKLTFSGGNTGIGVCVVVRTGN